MEVAHIPPSTPIHIAENGTPSGAPRNEQGQCDSMSDMISAILASRESLNVTHYELFSLSDADSRSAQPTGTLGIATDSYVRKPAFNVYRDVVRCRPSAVRRWCPAPCSVIAIAAGVVTSVGGARYLTSDAQRAAGYARVGYAPRRIRQVVGGDRIGGAGA